MLTRRTIATASQLNLTGEMQQDRRAGGDVLADDALGDSGRSGHSVKECNSDFASYGGTRCQRSAKRVRFSLMRTIALLAGTVALLANFALLYGGPFLIVGVWLARWRHRHEFPRWRWVMSWVSLSLATVATGAWTGTFTNIFPDHLGAGEVIERLRQGVTTSLAFLSCAFVAALLAKGKGRAWTVASAFIIPLQWLMWFGFPVIWLRLVS
jgi:hypothetical protein